MHIYIYSPPLLPSPSTQPPPTTTSTITTYHYNRHAPPSRVITSQGKRAMFVMSTNIYIAIARSPSLTLEWVLQCFTSGCTWCSVCALPHRGPCGLVCTYHIRSTVVLNRAHEEKLPQLFLFVIVYNLGPVIIKH